MAAPFGFLYRPRLPLLFVCGVSTYFIAACGDDDRSPPDAAAACELACAAPAALGTPSLTTTELSGLAASGTIPNLLWTHADAGNDARIYAIDTTAAARGRLDVTNATNTDWEDIAVAPCAAGSCIYLSDTGDNDLARTSVQIWEVPEPTSVPGNTQSVTATRYDLTYPDGPHDVEALFIDPRDRASYVIAKQTVAAAPVFAMPRMSTTASARQIASFTAPVGDKRVTGADLHVDDCGVHLLIRTHDHLFALAGSATATIPELFAATPVELPVAAEPQGEAIAIARDGLGYFTISEGAAVPLYRTVCH